MADNDMKFRIGLEGDEAVQRGLQNLGGAFDGFGGRVAIAVAKFTALKTAASAIIGPLLEAGERAEKISAAYGAMSGSIDEAARRMNNMVTSLDLVTAKNRAAQAGIELSGHDFANVAVAADKFADALGIDTQQAIDQLTSGIVSMNERGLRQFGIHVDSSKSRSENLNNIMKQLETSVGKTAAAADTLGGSLDQMKNALTDAKDGFIKGVAESDLFKSALAQLAGQSSKTEMTVAQSFERMGKSVARSVQEFFNATEDIGAHAYDLIRGDFGGMKDRVAARRREDFDAKVKQAQEDAVDMAIRAAAADAPTKLGGGGGGGGGKGKGGPAGPDLVAQRNLDRIEFEQREKQRAFDADMERLQEESDARQQFLNKEIDFYQQRQDAHKTLLAEQAKADEKYWGEYEARDRERKHLDDKFKADQEDKAKSITDQVDVVSRGVGGAMVQAFNAARAGEMSMGDALKSSLDAYLEKTAIEQGMEGLVNTAKGVAMLLFHPAGAANFFAAAGMNFAIAAAAGGAGAAISSPSGARGAGGGGNSTTQSASPSSFGTNDGGSGGQAPVYVINMNSLMPTAEAGRKAVEAIKAHERLTGRAA